MTLVHHLNSPVSPDVLDALVLVAQQGAHKAARNQADAEEFSRVAQFIGAQLELQQQQPLQALETRLRSEDRRALAWYLNILRTLCGTVAVEDHMHHLVIIPLMVTPAQKGVLSLSSFTHEIAGALEHVLDLGEGSFELHPHGVSSAILFGLTPLRWHALASARQGFALPAAPFGRLGALVGRWHVELGDRARLSRKLLHAMQRTPALNAWKMRTEALTEEAALGARARIFPAVLLQDAFTLLRQVTFNTQLEQAARQHAQAKQLQWVWKDREGELHWKLRTAANESAAGEASFPDEPVEFIEQQLARAAQRLQLELLPPLKSP